ncbi:MAG: acyl-ACP--UDP-N-acetylglucosamine O-acyltransferase [Candidatus Eisenbacteria bacterium]|uniref:Acyl-ACP--UDP-N-acetylglucosamine O-acyltransferase n=1 Tax=Eiseniibacteriota bacterium TaxID=2212470 RepID=A0A938BQL0_UNCEI|nr:acyl-ACP--UDP-N-acetylglucosamine O-acyltransferase [Candidatus Eisenbacteria bacterium]
MTTIHATAIVDPQAELGVDVEIGPYCLVGPRARIGDRCRLISMVRIDEGAILGEGCACHHGAAIGGPPQDLKYQGAASRVRAGAGNTFREFCTVHRATGEGEETLLGDENLIMAYAHVAHNCALGSHVILGNCATLAGHVEVGDYAIVSGVTPVHQFVKIGAHAIIGGGCRVPKDVPPFVMAAGHPLEVHGLNVVGLRRRGFSAETLAELEKLYRLFFRSDLVKEAALARIRAELAPLPEVEMFCRFIERSARGLTR